MYVHICTGVHSRAAPQVVDLGTNTFLSTLARHVFRMMHHFVHATSSNRCMDSRLIHELQTFVGAAPAEYLS